MSEIVDQLVAKVEKLKKKNKALVQEHGNKVVKILDLLKFYGKVKKDKITYKDWHLQMLNKMSANASSMPTEESKRSYVQSFIADNAFAQLKPRL